MGQIGFGYFIMSFKFISEIDGADGEAYTFDDPAIFDQRDLRAAAAEVEEDGIGHIDCIDGAQISQPGFRFSADRLNGQTRFPPHPVKKLGAIACVADGGSGYSEDGVGFHNSAHLGNITESRQRAFNCSRLQQLVSAHAFAQAQAFFLMVDQVVSSVGINVQDDQTGRVGTEVDDGNSFRHGFILRWLQKSGKNVVTQNNSA